jgi:hypothetical protein
MQRKDEITSVEGIDDEPGVEVLQLAQRKFGELLRQVCEIGGFTADKLSREAQAELERLRVQGNIPSDAPVGPLGPFTLCSIMAGTQAPTYYQVLLCVCVLGKHLTSQRFAEICRELEIEIPPDLAEKWKRWEQLLWHLAGFLSPAELAVLYEQTKDLQLIEIYYTECDGAEGS